MRAGDTSLAVSKDEDEDVLTARDVEEIVVDGRMGI